MVHRLQVEIRSIGHQNGAGKKGINIANNY